MALPLDDFERRKIEEKLELLVKMNIALQEQLKTNKIVELAKFDRLIKRMESSRVVTLSRLVKKLRAENAQLRKLL